jgi:hypothetical protein
MINWRKVARKIQWRMLIIPNSTISYNSRLFSSQNTDPAKKVLIDIEKGGTFDSRKRVSKIISNELRNKINDHVNSSSSGEYLFSSLRHKDMLKNSVNNKSNTFSTSYNGAMNGPKNETENFMNAFKSDIQGNHTINSTFSSGDKQNLSDFIKKQKPKRERKQKDVEEKPKSERKRKTAANIGRPKRELAFN